MHTITVSRSPGKVADYCCNLLLGENANFWEGIGVFSRAHGTLGVAQMQDKKLTLVIFWSDLWITEIHTWISVHV